MKLNRISKYIAVPFNVSITVLMLLFAVHFLQFIVTRTWQALRYEDVLKESERMEDPNSRIGRSHRNFLPDGTVHLADGGRYSRAGDGAFNLAGLLGYLALNHTAVIKCPVCGRRRGLERVDCVRCGAQLPVPERRKLDLIFDT